MTPQETALALRERGVFLTSSGRVLHVEDPDPGGVSIEDIATASAYIPRFGGHLRRWYSLAQHGVLVSDIVERSRKPQPSWVLAYALLHDAAEAYVGDIIRPVKRIVGPLYGPIEAAWLNAIGAALDVPLWLPMPSIVKLADEVALATEFRDVCDVPATVDGVPPMRDRVHVYRVAPFWRGRRAFLKRWEEVRP